MSSHGLLYHVTLFLISWVVTFQVIDSNSNVISSYFYEKKNICGVVELKARGCITLSFDAQMSHVQCAVRCQDSSSALCQGIVMEDTTGRCYFRNDCDVDDSTLTCLPGDETYASYKIVDVALPVGTCLNNGVYNYVQNKCDCQNYWVGTYCERLLTSCQELRDFGFALGEHHVDMNVLGRSAITKVMCFLGAGYTRTYISVSDGQGGFNATYQQYKNGFYNGPTSFWLGLDNIYNLNNDAGINWMIITLYVDGVGIKTTYKEITVADESQGYELGYSSVIIHGNILFVMLEECLLKRVQFSAWDQDNDAEGSRNLASEAGSGWWHKDVPTYCNPNGKAPTVSSSVSSLEYVSMRGANLSYAALGKDFDNVVFFFTQSYP